MRSLSLSRKRWQIKKIDLAYQNCTICIGICQCLRLFTVFGVSVFFILQGVFRKNV